MRSISISHRDIQTCMNSETLSVKKAQRRAKLERFKTLMDWSNGQFWIIILLLLILGSIWMIFDWCLFAHFKPLGDGWK